MERNVKQRMKEEEEPKIEEIESQSYEMRALSYLKSVEWSCALAKAVTRHRTRLAGGPRSLPQRWEAPRTRLSHLTAFASS